MIARKEMEQALAGNRKMLEKMEAALATLHAGGKVENLSIENAKRTIANLKLCIANQEKFFREEAEAALENFDYVGSRHHY